MPEVSFSKVDLPWGFLGNMAPFLITHNGQVWRTSEALFQSLRFDDPVIQEEIRLAQSPMGAKMIAKRKENKPKMVIEPMCEEDIKNMRYVIRLKFDAHPEIKRKLLNSGDALIIEDVGNRSKPRDLFWGMKKVGNSWLGKNTMGNLLMDLRESYRAAGMVP